MQCRRKMRVWGVKHSKMALGQKKIFAALLGSTTKNVGLLHSENGKMRNFGWWTSRGTCGSETDPHKKIRKNPWSGPKNKIRV